MSTEKNNIYPLASLLLTYVYYWLNLITND